MRTKQEIETILETEEIRNPHPKEDGHQMKKDLDIPAEYAQKPLIQP